MPNDWTADTYASSSARFYSSGTLGNNVLFGQHSLTGAIKGKQHQDDKRGGGVDEFQMSTTNYSLFCHKSRPMIPKFGPHASHPDNGRQR